MAVSAGFVGSVGSVGTSIHAREERRSGERATARAQKKANKIQKATTAVNRAIERRKSISAARRRQAANIAEAANLGIIGSSPLQGAVSSIGSQLATGLAGETRSFTSSQQTFDLRQEASNIQAKSERRAQDAEAIGGLFKQGSQVATSFI